MADTPPPPQQQQHAATAPLASLSAVVSKPAAGACAPRRSPAATPQLQQASRHRSRGNVVRRQQQHQQQQQQSAAARGAPTTVVAAAAAVTAQQQPRRGRRGLGAAAVPLAAGALAYALGRSAAAHVLPRVGAGCKALTVMLRQRLGGGAGDRPGAPSGRAPALLWFRSDLRLHDHEALAAACAARDVTSLLPVYVFDPREYGRSPTGFDKTGPYRARFISEALADLRARLRAAGSELVVRVGRPEDVLPKLARAVGAGAVYCHGEVAAAEARVEAAVRRALGRHAKGAALRVSWGGTLLHADDLPFGLRAVPQRYADFRAALKGAAVRAPLPAPGARLKGLPLGAAVPPGDVPSLAQLGFDAATLRRCEEDRSAAGARLRGGESEALRRLSEFAARFGGGGGGKKASAAAAAAPNFCCKVSPWLALGCLSPRTLYSELARRVGAAGAAAGAAQAGSTTALAPPAQAAQVVQVQAEGGGGGGGGEDASGMQWLLFELLWRDFFRFVTQSHTLTAGGKEAAAAAAPALVAA